MKMAPKETVELFKYCKINQYFNSPELHSLSRFYDETITVNGEKFSIRCQISDSDIRKYKKAQRVF